MGVTHPRSTYILQGRSKQRKSMVSRESVVATAARRQLAQPSALTSREPPWPPRLCVGLPADNQLTQQSGELPLTGSTPIKTEEEMEEEAATATNAPRCCGGSNLPSLLLAWLELTGKMCTTTINFLAAPGPGRPWNHLFPQWPSSSTKARRPSNVGL